MSEVEVGANGRLSSLRVQQRFLLESLESVKSQLSQTQTQLNQSEHRREEAERQKSHSEAAFASKFAVHCASVDLEQARNRAKISELQDQIFCLQNNKNRDLKTVEEPIISSLSDSLKEKDEEIGLLRQEIDRFQRLQQVHREQVGEVLTAMRSEREYRSMEREVVASRANTAQYHMQEEQIVALQHKISRLEASNADMAGQVEALRPAQETIAQWNAAFRRCFGSNSDPDPVNLITLYSRLQQDLDQANNRLVQSEARVKELVSENAILIESGPAHASVLKAAQHRAATLHRQLSLSMANEAMLKASNQNLKDIVASFEGEYSQIIAGKAVDSESAKVHEQLELLRSNIVDTIDLRDQIVALSKENKDFRTGQLS
uniref:Uncharacterized protein n=1 Tax=Spongospora subterranea TaxID=70186 RepID=A0A0H5R9N2_9EUKA|eukprot:CRZ10392.1 hypothetical protein [Spongospora subterranea]